MDQLVAAHATAVYRYALRLTRDPTHAEDLMQETLLRAWRRRSMLRDPAAARLWLLRIATNVHHDWLRARRPIVTLAAEPECACESAPTEARLEHRECVDRALAALDQLPARQRQVMHLATVEQLSHDQTAAVLGISLDAVKASLSIARRALREQLRDIYDDLRGARTS